MDQVDYDKLLGNATDRRDDMAAGPDTTMYDEILQKDDEQQNEQLMNSLFAVGGINPDQAAEAQKLGLELGVGPDIARRNMDELRKRAALLKAQEYRLTATSPILARQLTDPEFAAIAQDDLEQLTGTEKTVQVMKNLGSTVPSALFGLSSGIIGVGRAQVDLYGQGLDFGYRALGYDDKGENPAEMVGNWLGRYQTRQRELASYYATPEGKPGVVERGVYSGITSALRNIATAPLLLGGPAGAAAYMAVNVGAVGGDEYGKAREKGLNPLKATIYGGGQAAVEYATERLPLIKLLEDLGGGSGIVKTIARQMLPEIFGEQTATIVQDLNEWAALNPDKPFQSYIDERPSAAAETLIATVIATGGQTAVIKGAEKVFDHIDRAGADALRATLMADNLKRLTDSAAASKLRQRNPAAYQSYIAAQTQGTPVENMYIDASQLTEILNQSNLTNGELDAMLPGVREQLAAAILPGGNVAGDIVIPTAQYATTVAGTDLGNAMTPHVRMGEQAMSQSEAEQFEAQKEQLVAEATKVMDDKRESDKAFVQSANEVRTTLFEQIKATGIYTPEQARNAATLQAATYTMLANELKMTPSEVYALMPYKQVAGQAGQGTLSQGRASLDSVTDAATAANVSLDVTEKNGIITLTKIVAGNKNQGAGSKVMEALVQYADLTGQTIKLGASSQLGGDKARLIKFYERFGFRPAKRTAPASATWKDTVMVREPAMFRQAARMGYGEPAIRFNGQLFKASDYFPNWPKGSRPDVHDMSIADQEARAGEDLGPGMPEDPFWGHSELRQLAAERFGQDLVNQQIEADPEGGFGFVNAAGEFKSLKDLSAKNTLNQIDTQGEAFRNWFGDSKVVDEQGAPLVMYHGTASDFSAFRQDKTGASIDSGFLGSGSYFSSKADTAGYYAGVADRGQGGQNIMPVYVSLKNPFIWGPKTQGVRALVMRGEPLPAAIHDKVIERTGFKFDPNAEPDPLDERMLSEAVTAVLKEMGYDGVIASSGSDRVAEVVAFDPTQIKSTVGNRGTFDPNDPSILNQAPVAQTFLSGLNAREQALVNPIYTGGVPAKKLKGNEEAARWLEQHFTGDPITDFTAEIPDDVLREIGNVMAAEAIYALQKSGNAFDWYSEAMQRALKIAAVKWPVLGSDEAAAEAGFGTAENARFVFTYIMAVTSQNLDVAANATATSKAFDEMLVRVKAGDYTMSKAWGTGDKQAAMGKNFAKFGPLIKAMPGETFPEKLAHLDALFRDKMTVAEWVKLMKAEGIPYSKPGQTAMDATVYGSSLLGPKIGNGFWQNLNGNFSPLTIDLWMRRTWGRLTGKSIGNEAALPAQRRRLKASIARAINSPERDMDPLLETLMERRSVNAKLRALEARTDLSKKDKTAQVKKLKARLKELEDIAADYRGIPAPEPWNPAYDKDDAQLAAYAKRLLRTWDKEYKRLREKHGGKVPAKMQPTWARAAKRLKADLTTPLDQVANGTQRKQIEKAVAYAQKTLTDLGHNITTADLQAILWYPEKELWGALTTKLDLDEDGAPVIPPSSLNESYDTVFTRILNAEGYDTGTQSRTAGDAAGGSDGRTVAGGNAGERGSGRSEGDVVPGEGGSASNGQAQEGSGSGTLNQGPRGGYSPKQLTTLLNQSSDVSTVMHEFSHFYLDILTRLTSNPAATPRMKADLQALVEFGGATMDQWMGWTAEYEATGVIPEGMRKVHEAVAYSTEIYLFEGKAPSVELQSVFERFVRWMRQVYSNIREQLNAAYRQEFGEDLPVLTGEVRQVFDRMLASEDQIKQAEAVRNMAPIFGTQADSGMTDEEWAAYQAMLDEARDAAVTDLTKASLRQMQWLSNARGRILKDMQRKHEARRKEVRDEVKKEVSERPVYRAIEFLKRGKIDGEEVEYPVKLSIAEIEAMYGDSPIVGAIKKALGFGKFGMLGTENAIHPDQVAEIFGFKSGDAMVRELLAAPSLREAINAETDARMLAEGGDMNTPEAKEKAIEAALHNEARARFVAVELRFLEKATQPVRVMLKAAQQVARDVISRKVIKEIRPREFAIAEGRAAKKAIEAMKAGNSKDAAKAKQAQLLQNQLAAEAIAARQEVSDALTSFRNLFKADSKLAKGRNVDLVNAARAILAAYGIGKADKPPVEYVQQIRAYNPELYAELEPLILKASASAKPYDTLTMDEFRLMRDAVDALWYQARRDNQIMVEGRKLALETVMGELNTRLDEIGIPAEVPGEREAVGKKDKLVRSFFQGKAILRRVEHWASATDGPGGTGPFTKYIWRPMRKAIDAYRTQRNIYVKRYVELLQKVDLPVGKIEAPELGYTFGNANGGIGKAELLGAIMHTGNESNLRKLLLGRGWARELEDGTLDTTRWDAFRLRMIAENKLTKADYDFVQAVWDLNEELKPQAQRAHHDLFGYYFKEVQATPITTPFGVFRGGYVPAKTDPDMVRDAQVHQKMEDMESDFRNSMPSTGMGFTKGRVEYNKPLSLDVRLIAKHIDDVIRFSHVQPVVKDVLRILRQREFADNLTRIDPTVIEGMLLPWLNRAARQVTTEAGKHKAVDKFWSAVRSRTGIGIMFANITNALQQVTGYFPALLKVKPTYLKSALVQYMGGLQKMTEEVAELSPFMADRLENQVFDLQDTMNDLLLNPSRYNKVQKWAAHHGYFLQQAFQNQVDVVTWTATFNQTLAELGADKTDAEAVREAVARADGNVRMTQSSLMPEDISAFEVGSPFYKTLIQFSGYFNMIANLNSDEYIKVFRDLGWRGNKGKLAMIYMLGFGLPMLVSDAIVRTLGGGWDDDDDDGYLDVFMSWFFGSQVRGAVALIPAFGPGIASIGNAFNNKPYDDRMTTSPSISTLEAVTIGVAQTAINIVDPEKDVTGKNVRDVLTLVSLVTGIPVTVLGRPIGYQVDVSRGKIEPTSAVDYARGLLTGKASPSSRP